MKKFLSLVLALVMAMSLVTISAGATEYKDLTDKSTITYTEAVTVMNKLGIISGYSDSSFKPTAALTRGAAAKIIAFLNLGTTAANQLGVASAPYKDVKTTDTFAPYIAYCKSTGIIDGYADGTFRAGASLSGFAFSKMLLTSLGYTSAQEGFTGAGWETNVAKIAVKIGLYSGNDGFVGSSTVTREQACLYALNTLKATEVEYANATTSINIGGTTINIGGSKATPVTSTSAQYGHFGDAPVSGSYTVQFGEEHFSKLTLNSSSTDSFGRSANLWTLDGKEIGRYSNKTPIATYTASTKEADVKSALKDYTLSLKKGAYYVNGVAETADSTDASAVVTHIYGTNGIEDLTGNGRVVEVYANEGVINKIVVINSTLAKVTSVNTTDETITVAPVAGGSSITTTKGYGDFVKNDYVMVTPTYTALNGTYTTSSALAVAAATKVSGTVTSLVTSSGSEAATIGGTAYKKAASYIGTFSNLSVSSVAVVDAYLDAFGYLVSCDATAAAGNYLFVSLASFPATGDLGGQVYKFQAVMSDGTIGVYTASTVNGSTVNNDTPVQVGLYSYTVSDGKYALKAAASTNDAADYGHASGSTAISSSTVKLGSHYFADNVNFITIANVGTTTMKTTVYSGKQAMAGNVTVYYLTSKSVQSDEAGTITTAFVVGSDVVTSASDLVYFASASQNGYTVIDSTNYATYSAYVNGVKTTIAVKGTTPSANTFYTYGVDSNGVYSLSVKNGGVIAAPEYASVYGNYVTTSSLSGGEYSAANATIVDTRSNPTTTIDSLSALDDNHASVVISAIFNTTDKTISMIYVMAPSTATDLGVSYKIGSGTVVAAGDWSTAAGTVGAPKAVTLTATNVAAAATFTLTTTPAYGATLEKVSGTIPTVTADTNGTLSNVIVYKVTAQDGTTVCYYQVTLAIASVTD